MTTEEQKRKKRKKILKILAALMSVFLLIGCCSIGGLVFLADVPDSTSVPATEVVATVPPVVTTKANADNATLVAHTPEPTSTPQLPTAIPTVVVILEGVFAPGTYIVGTDLQPGTYRGQAGTGRESCYWERLSALDGEFGSIIANDNAEGQFYIEVKESDFALKTDCTIERLSD